ncbi:MAG TPA: pseudouridine synthase [Candidatus Sulfotelmatobacter sp.]
MKKTRRVGLARALSKLGYSSRSQAAELARAGHVRVNGSLQGDPGARVIENRDSITVDGVEVGAQRKIYVMLNKPRGVLTTASDEKERATVYECIRHLDVPWVAPVGRLDKASEGLLLLTNDSAWGARIAAPETHLEKTYHAQIGKVVDEEFVRHLMRGIESKGQILRAKGARYLRGGDKNSWLEIVLDEGKNRQIRRMMEAMGTEVLRLVRVAIGPLQLGELAKGKHRELTLEERLMLDRAMTRSNP